MSTAVTTKRTIITILALLTVFFFVLPQKANAQVCVPNACGGTNVLEPDESVCNGGKGCPGANEVCCVPPEGVGACEGINVLAHPECTIVFLGTATVILITALLGVGAIYLIWVFFKSAFLYILAEDDTKKTAQYRNAMLWSTIGVFGLAAVYGIWQLILDFIPNIRNFINFR